MEKYPSSPKPDFSPEIVPLEGVNFERDAHSELEAVAKATGCTVEEVIENNRLTRPNQA